MDWAITGVSRIDRVINRMAAFFITRLRIGARYFKHFLNSAEIYFTNAFSLLPSFKLLRPH